MRLSIQLVTYNGAKYIPYLFGSLRKQTFLDWGLLVIDNHSTDGTVTLVKKELENFPVSSRMIVNADNRGFAGGHNQAFKEAVGEYVLILNQDIYIEPTCLEKLVAFLDVNPTAAAVAPRLMRWDFSLNPPSPIRGGTEGGVQGLTNIIDSLGLKVFRNRRVVEQGAGLAYCHPERSEGSLSVGELRQRFFASLRMTIESNGESAEVFGVSGAMVMFRRHALDDVKFADGTIFDESYHSYKEDVDLAFRLRSAGYASGVLVDAIAFHDRSAIGAKELNDFAAADNKKNQSDFVRYHSYKNHLATLYKNEYWQNFILDFFWIVWYEVKKFGYFLLFDRRTLFGGWRELFKNRSKLRDYRRQTTDHRKVSWKEMRKWWE